MKKIKVIGIMGIISLVLIVLSIIMFIINVVVTSSPDFLTEAEIALANTTFVLWLISLIVGAIMAFIGSILILALDFENKEVNESKTLWGLLSMLLMGPLGLTIFWGINAKKTSDDPLASNYYQNQNTQGMQESSFTQQAQLNDENKLNNIEKAFKLLEQGSISKEEFEEIKKKNLE